MHAMCLDPDRPSEISPLTISLYWLPLR